MISNSGSNFEHNEPRPLTPPQPFPENIQSDDTPFAPIGDVPLPPPVPSSSQIKLVEDLDIDKIVAPSLNDRHIF